MHTDYRGIHRYLVRVSQRSVASWRVISRTDWVLDQNFLILHSCTHLWYRRNVGLTGLRCVGIRWRTVAEPTQQFFLVDGTCRVWWRYAIQSYIDTDTQVLLLLYNTAHNTIIPSQWETPFCEPTIQHFSFIASSWEWKWNSISTISLISNIFHIVDISVVL